MSDTAQIILAVIGTGVTLLGILVGLLLFLFRIQRQDATSLRQDIKENNARIDALDNRIDAMEGRLNSRIDSMASGLNSRIDALYQALFSRKDPAA